jgi:hypothetical protein
MKRLILLLTIIWAYTLTTPVNAQVHTLEHLGFDTKVVTLSKGKYQEFHDLKAVVEIGSILFNTETKEIIGFVLEDTLVENHLKPHIVSRWISPDPLSHEYLSWSPYHYAMNNPIRFTDVLGMGAGDFYDEKGKFLGTDGIDDGKIYVVTEKQEKKQISSTNKKGGTTQVSDVKSATELPSPYVRGEMKKAAERAGSPSFHEEGGFFGKKDGQEYVAHAKPGDAVDPSIDDYASINVYKTANKTEWDKASGGTIEGSFHTHPDGTVVKNGVTYSFENQPSNKIDKITGTPMGDIPNARENVMGATGNHYVLAQGNTTVYIYNGSGTIARFPFRKFFTIGINQ